MIHNFTEDHVADAYQRVVNHYATFCGCDTCRNDVLVYALNRLPARYVATDEGVAVTEFQLEKGQNRADIEVTLIAGIQTVAAAPRCGSKAQQL